MKKWLVNKTNPEYVEYVSRIASVSSAFAQILISRGIKTPHMLDSFLNSDITKLTDPFELPSINIAIDRIKHAKNNRERVLICGDYDADGVTATAIMVEGLHKYGLDVHFFIPNRIAHGYGFDKAGIEKAIKIGAKLIITVDCGISSFDAVSSASSHGIDVIVTDHHEPLRQKKDKEKGDFLLPDALAIINPKISMHNIELQNLSGAGIAFKLIHAIFGSIDDVHELFDLAAIGTAADVVPVTGDNRIILKEGIKLIQSAQRAGIRALKEASGIRTDFFRTSLLQYALIPRINAAGRIDDANRVVRLLTTKSDSEAEELAQWLNDLNSKRQDIEESVYNDALRILNNEDGSFERGAIVLASEGWHHGVVGIVASRIAEEYYRPVFILSIKDGIAKGSARSIPPFDIYEGLSQCKDTIKSFGGHRQAAGLSLLSSDIEQFRKMISDIIFNTISEDDLIPVLNIDAAVNLSDIKEELINEISRLEPFGYGNEEPVLGTKRLKPIQPRIVGNNHLKVYLRQNGRGMDSIGFSFGNMINMVEDSNLVDIAFLPVINEWEGRKNLQLNLRAIRPSV